MDKAAQMSAILSPWIGILTVVVAYIKNSRWPLILLGILLLICAGLQIWAALWNRPQNMFDPLGDHAKVAELTSDLNKIYGDCIYNWAANVNRNNARFSADQLRHALNLTQEQVDMGIKYLNAARVINRDSFGWVIDPCHNLVPEFQKTWVTT
jgi:hypothetical protein